MNKKERKERYKEIINLMLEQQTEEAFKKLTLMCGEDTGLFVISDYNKLVETRKRIKEKLAEIKNRPK